MSRCPLALHYCFVYFLSFLIVQASKKSENGNVSLFLFARDVLKGERQKDQASLAVKRTAENAPTRTHVGQI